MFQPPALSTLLCNDGRSGSSPRATLEHLPCMLFSSAEALASLQLQQELFSLAPGAHSCSSCVPTSTCNCVAPRTSLDQHFHTTWRLPRPLLRRKEDLLRLHVTRKARGGVLDRPRKQEALQRRANAAAKWRGMGVQTLLVSATAPTTTGFVPFQTES